MVEKCRLCGCKFPDTPLLIYENMPKAAQFLPDVETVKNEKGIDMNIFQCRGCGLVQLNSEPVSYYKEVIRAAAFSPEMKSFRINQFTTFVEQYSLYNKKVVEIGCGKGEYLLLMKQAGANVYGIEQSAESVTYCEQAGLNILNGFITDFPGKLKNAPFDAFFILNFLEHLPDINSILTAIRNNLTDEGIGLVEVPNFDMMLRKKVFSEFIPDHLFYFTADTLQTALRLNGFDVISCKEIWYDYIISAVVKTRKKLDISDFHQCQTKLTQEIDAYINKFGNKRVAVWGAGHQALAMISLAKLAGKIKYVVDSAPFKQGKFTPATHIPIVSPEQLKINPVDAVIVMAAGYSDEVAKIIQQKFDKTIVVAIFRDFGLEII